MNAPLAVRSASFSLTPRDLDIIYSVGTYKYLSIFQLQRLHFPFAQSYRAASNRIAALVSAGLLSRVFHHPRLTAHTGRPASILYLQSENLATLATLLARMSRASLFDRFHDIRQPTATILPTASSCTSLAYPTSTLPLNYPTAPRPLFSGSAPARKWKA